MMSSLEIKKLKEWSPLPITVGTIMLFAPWLILSPKIQDLSAAEAYLDSNLKSVKKTIEQLSGDNRMGEKRLRMLSKLECVDRWLLPESFLPDIIDAFHDLAKIFSVKIISVNYGFPKNPLESIPPRVSIGFNIEAEYAAMRAFLQSLEHFPLPILPVEITANNRTFTMEIVHLMRL